MPKAKKATEDRGPKNREQIIKDARPDRLSIAEARNILTVEGRDKNRHYRWVSDRDGGRRIEMWKRRGYRIETDQTLQVGDSNERRAVGEGGSLIREYVGSSKDGGAEYSYLMSIQKEYYEEDRAWLDEQVDEIEEAILNPDLEDDERVADYVRDEHSLKNKRVKARIRKR